MDSNIILSSGGKTLSTVISNKFIDKYMADANGGFVKVYVYLLRLNQDPTRTVSISLIAEELDETEKDIRSALKYWADKGVLSLTKKGKVITGITIKDLDDYEDEDSDDEDEYEDDDASKDIVMSTVSASNINHCSNIEKDDSGKYRLDTNVFEDAVSVPAQKCGTVTVDNSAVYDENHRPNYTPKIMNQYKETIPEYKLLTDEIEVLYGSPLTVNDMKEITFIFEQLNFPVEVIKYLYDYCINIRKKNPRERSFINYVDTTAIEWHKSGSVTLEKAMQEVESFSSTAVMVKKALGLPGKLLPDQVDIIKKWSREFGFSDEIIREACKRGVLQAKGSEPTLNYIDSILTKWYNSKVTSLADIDKLDADHKKEKATEAKTAAVASGSSKTQKAPHFDYAQHNYTDEELQRQKLKLLHRSLINK